MNIDIIKDTNPRRLTVSAARGCYSSRPIKPEECEEWKTQNTNTDDLLRDLYIAEHNTTQEHSHFSFEIKGVSRHFIWRYLHGFPFYSTDQQSQRYVKMKVENFHIPEFLSDDDKILWKNYYEKCFSSYEDITKELEKTFDENKMLNKQQEKRKMGKTIEFARYVIPLGQLSFLTYTINFITAVRLIGYLSNLKEINECSQEANLFAKMLEEKVLEIEPKVKPIIDLAKKDFTAIVDNLFNVEIPYKERFDVLEKERNVNIISDNFDVFNKLNIKPNNNYKFSPVVPNFNMLPSFDTEILCSHSCDSQNQRHRTSDGYRPELKSYYYELKTKYYTPDILNYTDKLKLMYHTQIKEMYDFFNIMRDKYGFNNVIYLLPNSQYVYFIEKNKLSYFSHKAQKRLCFNSQEEIFNLTKKQVLDLSKKIDINEFNLIPPCSVNNKYGIKPTCPEGDRFCGIKVWKIPTVSELNRII